jgi:small subunit ribosomal protein S8
MSITDPIADMVTKIRNASSARKEKVDVKASKISEEILKIMKAEGFIEDYKNITEEHKQGALRVYLKFGEDKTPYITNIKRISTPGRRAYRKSEETRPVLSGLGIAILSTSQGIMSDRDARGRKVGGELMLEVW